MNTVKNNAKIKQGRSICKLAKTYMNDFLLDLLSKVWRVNENRNDKNPKTNIDPIIQLNFAGLIGMS